MTRVYIDDQWLPIPPEMLDGWFILSAVEGARIDIVLWFTLEETDD